MARLPKNPWAWKRMTAPISLAVILMLSASCGRGPQVDTGESSSPAPPPGPGAVAVVNGQEITVEDYAGELAAAAFLAKSASMEGRMEVLDKMIDDLLLVQDARARGILERPMVQRMIKRLRRRYALLETRQLISSEVPEPPKEEIDAIIGEPQESVDLTVILATDQEAGEAAIARIEAGEPMEDVARDVSISPGAQYAGSVTRKGLKRGSDMYPPQVEEEIFSLELGEISSPLPTPVGFLVARLDARHIQSKEELEAMRPAVIAGWKRQQLVKKLEEETTKRRMTSDIKILVENFQDADLPDPDQNPAVIWRALEEIDIADVNGTILTMGDLFRNTGDYTRLLKKREESHNKTYQNFLQDNIDQVLLLEYAREKGLDRKPNIDAIIDRYTGNLLQAQEMVDLALTVTEEKLDEKECENYFEERRDRYPVPAVFELSHILVRRREQVDEVLSRYRSGESFEALARELSAAPSAADGGDLGRVLADELDYMLDDQGVDALIASARQKRGDMVTIRTAAGYNMFLIREFVEAGEGGFADVRERVLPDFLDFCRRQTVTDHIAALREKASISIDRDKVASIEPAAGAPPGASPHGGGSIGAPGGSPHGGSPGGGFNPHGGGGAPGGSPHGGSPGGGFSPHGGAAPGGSPHGGGAPGTP